MSQKIHRKDHAIQREKSLKNLYPPSRPCSCAICRSYCNRPGWWTVAEAALAIAGGYAGRMMLEMSTDLTFGVLSPAIPGREAAFADYRLKGCTFLQDGRCELHGTGLQPLECRFCHHDRPGQGPQCHAAIGQDWNSSAGRELVVEWSKQTGLWDRVILTRSQD